jgi:hypothetical protein
LGLQAAETLMQRGFKVAYARFNFDQMGMQEVTEAIKILASGGISHFFE